MSEPAPAQKPPSLLRSSIIFSAMTLISRVLGFARDLVVTAVLGGASNIGGDAFYTGQAFPNLFRRIFAEGAFAAAFVPAYSKALGGKGSTEADRLASEALAAVGFASVVLTLIAQLAMPWIQMVYSPGYLDDPAKFKLTVILTQITMPYLPCMVIASLFSGVLNARGRFVVSGIYPTILNVVMLLAVLPQKDPVGAAYAGSIATIVGGALQAAMVWVFAARAGARVRLQWPRLTPEVKQLIRTGTPAAFANSATQINIVVAAMLAAQIDGMRVWMAVAERLYQLPWSLVGVAIGIALLPRLSDAFRRDDTADVKQAMDQALVWSLALCLPAAAALIAMPHFLVDALFTRGDFLPDDADATSLLLLNYGWGVPAFVLLRILQPAYFARGDTKTPMIYSLISVAVNAVLAVTLFLGLHAYWGVAVATSAAAWLNVVQMWITLVRRGHYAADARVVAKAARVLAAAGAMGAILVGAVWYRLDLEALVGGKEVAVVLTVAVGGLAYFALIFAFGGVTVAEAKAALKRKPRDPPAEPSA